jgi:hypothetical protein
MATFGNVNVAPVMTALIGQLVGVVLVDADLDFEVLHATKAVLGQPTSRNDRLKLGHPRLSKLLLEDDVQVGLGDGSDSRDYYSKSCCKGYQGRSCRNWSSVTLGGLAMNTN